DERIAHIHRDRRLMLLGRHPLRFVPAEHLCYLRRPLAAHPNGMRFVALADDGRELIRREYHSVGGGFVVAADEPPEAPSNAALPYAFNTGAELLALCAAERCGISDIVRANEAARRAPAATRQSV